MVNVVDKPRFEMGFGFVFSSSAAICVICG